MKQKALGMNEIVSRAFIIRRRKQMDNKMVELNKKELEKVDGGFVISTGWFLGCCIAAILASAGVVGLLS